MNQILDNRNVDYHHNGGIDLLRGFSILSVILLHCKIHMPFSQEFLPKRIQNIIFSTGYYGVCIFFVISGFLITTTCLKRWGSLPNINIIRFYQMRFARIIPCLLLLLFVLSLFDLMGITGFKITTTSLSQALFSALTFHLNWLEAQTGYLPASWDVLWSLSVEEMFYIFFPIICLIFKKPSHFIVIMFIFIVLGPLARTVFSDNEMWSDHSYLSCMDGIAFGSLSAFIANYFKMNKKWLTVLFISGLFIFTFVFAFRKETASLGISALGLNVTLLEIGISFILIVMQEWYVNNNRKSSFITFPLRWFGRNSYEIYLTHSFLIITFSHFIVSKNQSISIILMEYAIVILLSGTFGQFISNYFSSPMNQFLREKKEKAKAVFNYSK